MDVFFIFFFLFHILKVLSTLSFILDEVEAGEFRISLEFCCIDRPSDSRIFNYSFGNKTIQVDISSFSFGAFRESLYEQAQ